MEKQTREVPKWRFGILTRLPIPDRDKIDLTLPAFTLDVNQIALKEPQALPPNMHGLVCLEYHYFAAGAVRLLC